MAGWVSYSLPVPATAAAAAVTATACTSSDVTNLLLATKERPAQPVPKPVQPVQPVVTAPSLLLSEHYHPNTQCRIGLISEVIVISIVNPIATLVSVTFFAILSSHFFPKGFCACRY